MRMISLLAKSKRAAERLLESKLKLNVQKSKAVSVLARKHFKCLGFCLRKTERAFIYGLTGTPWPKAKRKLKGLTRRYQGRNVRKVRE